MDETPPNVRTRKEIKQSLLKKAIKEGRGPEMISQIQWRLGLSRHMSDADKGVLKETLNVDDGQPRSVRMLNTLARHTGDDERYVHTKAPVLEPPPTLQ